MSVVAVTRPARSRTRTSVALKPAPRHFGHVHWKVLHDRTELANSITHGLGLALSLAGAWLLVKQAAATGAWQHLVSCSIYASTLVAVYAASTLSHVFHSPRINRLFRILDQGFIFLLIAGSYTPFGMTYLHGSWWLLSAAIWSVAIWGFLRKVIWAHRIDCVSVRTCVLLGWLPAVAVPTLTYLAPAPALWLMLAGGVAYTVGTLFLIWDDRHVYFHPIWHLFVIAGSACHFAAIYGYVIPPA